MVAGVTFDPNTPKVTLNASDGTKANESWTYRLVYNSGPYMDFNPAGCYMELHASFMVAPVPSYDLVMNELTPTDYTFESYEYQGDPLLCGTVSYNLQGL